MSRTYRYDNGLNKGRDDKPFDARCAPTSSHPKGYDTFDDDHGHYGAGGHRVMKKGASAARRIWHKNYLRIELADYFDQLEEDREIQRKEDEYQDQFISDSLYVIVWMTISVMIFMTILLIMFISTTI